MRGMLFKTFLVSVAVPVAVAGCGTEPSKPRARSGDGPRLVVPEREVDLGEIVISPEGHVATVPLFNAGAGERRIDTLEKSCRCTDVELSRNPIPPRGEAELSILVHPKEGGLGSAIVRIRSNDPQEPDFRVGVTWRALAPLEVTPMKVDFGRVAPGDSVELTARITKRTGECAAASVQSSTPELSAALVDSPDGRALRLSLVAGRRRETREARVFVRLSGCWRESLTVPVTWVVRGAVDARPARLFLGAGEAGGTLSKEFVVSTADGEHLEIAGAEWTEPLAGAKMGVVTEGESEVRWRVTWKLPTAAGPQAGELRIRCAAPSQEVLTIPVTGVVLAPDRAASEAGDHT